MSILAISEPVPRWMAIPAASWMDAYTMPESPLLVPSLVLADHGAERSTMRHQSPGLLDFGITLNRLFMTPSWQVIFKGACHLFVH